MLGRHLACLSRPARRIFTVFVGNTRLEGIVRVRFAQEVLDGFEHGAYATAGFPAFALEDPDADAALVVKGHIRVPDARGKVNNGRFKGIRDGEVDVEEEAASLRINVSRGTATGADRAPTA